MKDSFADLSALTLGTVQLGLAYGIANGAGLPAAATAAAVLDAAHAGGITCLDTSRDYGCSEDRIGGWLAGRTDGPRHPRLVTKVPKTPAGQAVGPWVRQQVEISLRTLGVERVDGVLLRSEQFLLPEARDALCRLQAEGRVGAFGLSAYDPDHLAQALESDDLGAVQLPMNVLDSRCHQRGLLEQCLRRNVTVFVRSAYLQGLLLMDPAALPAPMAAAAPLLMGLERLAAANGWTRAQLALAWVRDTPGVSSVVVGAESVAQVEGSLAAAAAPILPAALRQAVARLAADAPAWLADPRIWPKT